MTTGTDAEQGFSLVRGDLLFRLQQRLGLIPAGGLGLVRRAVFWAALGWLPIALWGVYTGRALPGAVAEPLLSHYGVHARLLFAVPLLILAEGPANALVLRLLSHFVRSGVVPPESRGQFDAVVQWAARLRDATLPWIVVVAAVATFVGVSGFVLHVHEADWARSGTARNGLGFGGLWYLYVGRLIFLTLVLGWLWRVALLAALLWRVARVDLALVPTHPDRVGGLGFLERLPTVFAPLAFAFGVVAGSRWAHDALHHGLQLTSRLGEMGLFVAACVVVFTLPLLVFAVPLQRLKTQALLDYGDLVGRQGRLVHARWIEGREVGDTALLEAPELGPVADTSALFAAVKSMRAAPIGIASVLPVFLAAGVPMVAVLALQVPVMEYLLKLLRTLI